MLDLLQWIVGYSIANLFLTTPWVHFNEPIAYLRTTGLEKREVTQPDNKCSSKGSLYTYIFNGYRTPVTPLVSPTGDIQTPAPIGGSLSVPVVVLG